MNNQQPVYLFAGGRGKTIFSSFKEIGKIIQGLGENPEVAIVGAASLKDNRLIYALMAFLVKSNCKCRVRRVAITHPKADIEKAKKILERADIIFMGGGDAEEGMKILKEKKMDGFLQELAQQGKLFLGVSAGTIMLSREWVRWQNPDDDATCENYHCLGLAQVICDTHAEGDDWIELKAALQLQREGAVGYGIPSGAYLKAYPDGRIEAFIKPAAKFSKIDGKIEKQHDLLPAGL
jgi:dipeptidase E